MRPSQLLSIALLSSTISAWSLQGSLADIKAIQGVERLFRRADDPESSSNPNAPTSTMNSAPTNSAQSSGDSSDSTQSSSGSKPTDSSDSSSTSDDSSPSQTGSASQKPSGSSGNSGSAKTTGKATSTAKSSGKGDSVTSTQSYNASVGFGGLSMITPNPQSSSSYYKVGNYLTFAWNMTSLSITPTALDILATCTANQATYTIAMNQTVNGTEGAVTWDTGEYQSTATISLLTETYTLIIHDAALDATATAPYGGLPAFSQFRFAMYTPQPADTNGPTGIRCITCSGAMSQSERQTLGFVFGMAAIAVVSFTCFAGSFGVF